MSVLFPLIVMFFVPGRLAHFSSYLRASLLLQTGGWGIAVEGVFVLLSFCTCVFALGFSVLDASLTRRV